MFSYDPSTAAGQVRLLCTDTDAANAIFQDEEISAFLALESDVIRYAAAQALEVIAASEVLTQKRLKTMDLQTDGPSQAKELRELATALRASEDRLGAFDIAEQVQDTFSARERLFKQFIRGRI